METINSSIIAELLKLSPEAKQSLAATLLGSDQPVKADTGKALSNICDQALSLVCSIEQLRAVSQSFADEYIDDDDKALMMNIAYRTKHYCNLFNAMASMLCNIEQEAKALEDATTEAFKATRAGA